MTTNTIFQAVYESPIGQILLSATDCALIDATFQNEPVKDMKIRENNILRKTIAWYESYFKGKDPSFALPLDPDGTPFYKDVWKILSTIPSGQTMAYSEVAEAVMKMRGLERMSGQAVGNAVKHNHIAIIIPCHRVVGKDGSLTGFNAGMDRKVFLLCHEGHRLSSIRAKDDRYITTYQNSKWRLEK